MLILFLLFCFQQKHSRPTGKVEVKIKEVKETVCFRDIHYVKNNN